MYGNVCWKLAPLCTFQGFVFRFACLFFVPPSNMNKLKLQLIQDQWQNKSWGKLAFYSHVIILHNAYMSCNCQSCVLSIAPLTANWSVSVENTTKNSITIQWPNLMPILNEPVLHYFGLIKNTNGSILNCHITSANVTSVAFTGLLQYREYRLSAVGVNGIGQAHSSAEVTAWTEEGGM